MAQLLFCQHLEPARQDTDLQLADGILRQCKEFAIQVDGQGRLGFQVYFPTPALPNLGMISRQLSASCQARHVPQKLPPGKSACM